MKYWIIFQTLSFSVDLHFLKWMTEMKLNEMNNEWMKVDNILSVEAGGYVSVLHEVAVSQQCDGDAGSSSAGYWGAEHIRCLHWDELFPERGEEGVHDSCQLYIELFTLLTTYKGSSCTTFWLQKWQHRTERATLCWNCKWVSEIDKQRMWGLVCCPVCVWYQISSWLCSTS